MFYLFQISIGEFQRVEDYLKSQLGVPTTVAKTLENLRNLSLAATIGRSCPSHSGNVAPSPKKEHVLFSMIFPYIGNNNPN